MTDSQEVPQILRHLAPAMRCIWHISETIFWGSWPTWRNGLQYNCLEA